MSILLAYGCDDDSSSATRGSTGGVMYRDVAGVPTTPMNTTNAGGSQMIAPVTAGMMPSPTGGASTGGTISEDTAGGQMAGMPASGGSPITAGMAASGGTIMAGGLMMPGGMNASGGMQAQNVGGALEPQQCRDLTVVMACDIDGEVMACFARVGTCSGGGGDCSRNSDCAAGFCYTDMRCNALQANCVESRGYPAMAACLRLYISCLQDGEGNDAECGQRSSECVFDLPECPNE